MLQLASLVRDACRSPGDRLNIFLIRTAEAFDTRLCRARSADTFWAPSLPDVGPWDLNAYVVPDNLVLLPDKYPPDHVPFDLVVAPFRPQVTAAARSMSAQLQVPLVHLLVDPPDPGLSEGRVLALGDRLGHYVVAPDDRTAAAWRVGSYLKAKNWSEPALGRAIEQCVGGPYQMRWGFDG